MYAIRNHQRHGRTDGRTDVKRSHDRYIAKACSGKKRLLHLCDKLSYWLSVLYRRYMILMIMMKLVELLMRCCLARMPPGRTCWCSEGSSSSSSSIRALSRSLCSLSRLSCAATGVAGRSARSIRRRCAVPGWMHGPRTAGRRCYAAAIEAVSPTTNEKLLLCWTAAVACNSLHA